MTVKDGIIESVRRRRRAALVFLLPFLAALLPLACARPGERTGGDAGGNNGSGGGNTADDASGASGGAGGAPSPSDGPATTGTGGTVPDASADGLPVPPDGGPAPPPAFDWVGVIGTGQSLAVGNLGVPPSDRTTTFHNLKLTLGRNMTAPPFDDTDPSLAMAPLSEPIRTLVPLSQFPSAYPANIFGETPHTFMADQISTLYARGNSGEYHTVHSVIGESGQGISVIGKGARDTGRTGRAYSVTLFEVKAIARLARTAGKSYGIGAIVFTHGEQDASSKTYGDDVHQLWADYNTDLRAITGQTTTIPMLMTQQHSAPFDAGSSAESTLAAWRLGVRDPANFVCVGPKYQYQYASEGRHLVTSEYDRLGIKYGQVFYEKVVLGRDWQPLQPTAVVKNGNVITVDFHVPVPPLNWDDNIAPSHQTALTEWAKGRGFEVRSAAGRVAIDSVALNGTKVLITLAGDNPGGPLVVGYANAQDLAGAMAGPTRGRRGQLRDADPFVGIDAQTISCHVTRGSAQVTAATTGGFRARGGRELAVADGLPPETIVVAKTSDSALTLSQPWAGATGTVDIAFHSDQRNYAVAFELPVP